MQRILLIIGLFIGLPAFSQLGKPYYDSTKQKWGYRLDDGKIFVQPAYDLALPWNSAGLAAVNIGRKETKVKGVTTITPGKWGLLHYQSGLVIPAEFDAIIPYNDDLFYFNMDAKVNANGFMSGGKWGIMNRKTKALVLDPDYDFIGPGNSSSGVYAVYKGGNYLYDGYLSMPDKNSKGRWGLVNTNKQNLTGFTFHSIRIDWNAGFLLRDATTGKMSLCDLRGKKITEPIYDTIQSFSSRDSLALARKQGKYGFLHSSGKESIPFIYDRIEDENFDKDFIIAQREGNAFVVDMNGKEMQDPPKNMEDRFQEKIRAANNSKERGLVLADHENGLKAAGYSNGHTGYLMGKKMVQVADIDFYGIFEYVMKSKSTLSFRGATSILSADQRKAIKSLAQYTVDEFVARDKGQTAPAWPSGVPKPGYGWGKTVSSDRYVAPTNPAPAAVQQPRYSKAELKEKYQGKWFLIYVYGNRMLGRVARIDNEYSVLVYFKSIIPGTNQDWLFYSPADLETFKQLKNTYTTCNYCDGSGVVSNTYKHTNDYTYTLGQKHIYTTTTQSYCRQCCNGLIPVEPGAKCEW